MLAQQFLVSCTNPHHPGHKHLNKPRAPRDRKKTIYHYEDDVNSLLNDAAPDPIKAAIKLIHTRVVRDAIASYPPNKVLNTNPPQINKEEENLSRKIRVKLSQLRSGYSPQLHSYLCRIEPGKEDKCPLCDKTQHDTIHLFNCEKNPTTLTAEDLWKKMGGALPKNSFTRNGNINNIATDTT